MCTITQIRQDKAIILTRWLVPWRRVGTNENHVREEAKRTQPKMKDRGTKTEATDRLAWSCNEFIRPWTDFSGHAALAST